LWHRQRLGDVAGRKPFLRVLHQQPEHVEPRRLRQRGQCQNGVV